METLSYHKYCNLLPEMTTDDFVALTGDIKENGLINPIILYENQILDGKHRYKACLAADIKPAFTEFTGDNEKALNYVISQNVKRRNLNMGQRAILSTEITAEFEVIAAKKQKEAGKLGVLGAELGKLGGRGISKDSKEYLEKKELLELDDIRNDDESGNPLKEKFPEGGFHKKGDKKTAEQSRDKAAKIMGVNSHYVSDAKKIKEQSPEFIKPILDGKINIQDAKRMLKLSNPVKEKLINKINESESINVRKAITEINKGIKGETVLQEIKKDIAEKLNIRHCSMQELLSDKTLKIDAIITDPPYVKESLHLFEELAKLSKDIPLVAVMTGQYHLPQIMESMCKYLKYRWTFAYLTPGRTNQQHQRKINTTWKPVVIFGELNEWIPIDVVTSNAEDKEFHIWGQSISGFTELIERLTSPGQIICDPFTGGGTTAVACLKTGRRFVGCDIDENHVKTAVERCNQEII